ncbi:predicted protein [Scheffersomyces stipitis CBS 6054]|uniref:BAR domain-containing protein n=1 Tax=Scheffersomyces stipitis (strain ATCC 58785 / CBS 6054 / NBRC 10063 / NRRL Y-11545) TaxID=322104 RepID=A3GI15_PICST|nr:predicted protein [Scheffersomyces stipitis CBS 6054]EAZ63153.2 predicted protein [Scheffersomyces stipitis CBS 6054]KAG2734991.1 hypothetical protein G9P44_001205 [Scheffersomyces stipitis]
MSWNGLKKAINRAGAQVMLKTGQIESSTDKEFEFEEHRYRAMETTSTKLQRELKHYMESLRLLSNAQINVGESLSSFYGASPSSELGADKSTVKHSELSQLYYDVVKDLSEKCFTDVETPYNQTVLNPVSRFNSYYVEVNEAIKKRARKQIDYDALKSKVKKLIEKPNSSDAEYETKLASAQSDLQESEKTYLALNDQLKDELPKLVNLRIPFLDPSFEAFVKIQLRFFTESYEELNNLQMKLDAKTREDYINGKLDKKVDDVLVKMKELNITG